VLELGCGAAQWSIALHRLSADVTKTRLLRASARARASLDAGQGGSRL